MSPILLRFTRESEAANTIDPRFQIALLRQLVVSRPGHSRLRNVTEGQQCLPASNTDRLVIGQLLSVGERLR